MGRHSASKTTLRVDVQPAPASGGARRGVLTILAGGSPGTMLAFPDRDGGELVIGRTDEAAVAIDEDSLSRRHARFFRLHGEHFVQDLDSTNGTFVDGARISEPVPLRDGARVQLGLRLVLRFRLQDEAELEAARRLYEATVRDALTGAFNRHFLDERLASEMSFAKRHGAPLSLLFVDADHFKRVNDTHGHPAGDEVLRRIAKLLLDTMRSEDVVARYGGEEFVVLLRGVDEIGLLSVAERVRAGVEGLAIAHEGTPIAVTVSVGGATQSPRREVESGEALLAVADGALYRAKEAGRNRVVLG